MGSTVTIPVGATVLVTGANGFIGANVVKQFLERGYRVRGTVRDLAASSWLAETTFQQYVKRGDLELVQVADMSQEGAFDEAVRGVAAIVHVATITALSPDPHQVVPQTVAGVESILRSAAKEPSVQEFVYTSSVVAASRIGAGIEFQVDANSWNDSAVELAWKPAPYEPERTMIVYAASKVAAERAFWNFMETEKPGFRGNTVLPFTVWGPMLHPLQKPTTTAWLFMLYEGVTSNIAPITAVNIVDVRDVALMHVIAVLDPTVNNMRLHTWSANANWNDVLALLRRLRPREKFINDMPGQSQLKGTVRDSKERELLKKWANQDGFLDLETITRDTLDGPWPKVKGIFDIGSTHLVGGAG